MKRKDWLLWNSGEIPHEASGEQDGTDYNWSDDSRRVPRIRDASPGDTDNEQSKDVYRKMPKKSRSLNS